MIKKTYISPDMELVKYTLSDVLYASKPDPTTDPEIGGRIGDDPDEEIEF